MSIMSAMRDYSRGRFIQPGQRCEVTITGFEEITSRSGNLAVRLTAEDASGRTVTNYFTAGWAFLSFLGLFFSDTELDQCSDEDVPQIVGRRFIATTGESNDGRYVNIQRREPARPVAASSGDDEAEQAF